MPQRNSIITREQVGHESEKALGYRLDSAELDKLVGALVFHKAELLGTNRLDDNETAILGPALEQIRARENTVKKPDLKARVLVPVTHEMDPGATSFSYKVWKESGMAEMIGNPSDDVTKVGLTAEKFTHAIEAIAAGYDWTIDDMEASALAGLPLRSRKAQAVHNAFERKIEIIAATGYEGTAVTGLLNHPNVPVINAVAAAGGGNSPVWGVDKTPQEVLDDLKLMEDTVSDNTDGVEVGNTLVLPRAKYRYIQKTPLNTGAGSDPKDTILKVFLEQSDGITDVDWWKPCETADGAGTGPRATLYKRDPQIVHLEIPLERREHPPQAKNFVLEVLSRGKVAGVIWEYPLAAIHMDGI